MRKYLNKSVCLCLLLSGVLSANSASVLDMDFTTAEGFTNGPVSGVQGMNAQGGWEAGDVDGRGYLFCSNSYNRARNLSDFTLETGHSVVIETTLRLQCAGGSFGDGDYFRIGFAENAQHAGANTPSIGSSIHVLSDGSYWLGDSGIGEAISIPASSSNHWIKFTQTISRNSTSNEFYGNISAYNETTATDLGSTPFSWIQNTDDGSWGGNMRPSLRAWSLPGSVELQVDRWTVYTSNSAPPLVTHTSPPVVTNGVVHILIDPEVSVAIGGHLELDRKQFISLSDAGKKFEGKVANSSAVDYYTDDLGLNFGRELGGAFGVVGWNKSAVKQDPLRPGYVDMANLTSKLNPDNGGSSAAFMNKFAPNLDIAQHDRYGAGSQTNGCVPSFMGVWVAAGDDPKHRNAVNADAYGEFIAGILEHGYTDWTRPATYEIVNEPHWNATPDQRFADIHLAVKQKVNDAGLDVAIGGPCISVGYFYKNNYQSFGLADFIDNTGCALDFYSFHVYDFMHFDSAKNDFAGRVSTGLPIEGVLDMVQNYTLLNHGRAVDVVLSEHGGYISADQEQALDTIAATYFPSNSFPGTLFEWEMKRRSVSECLAVRSAIANTLAFMNNPHVVRKAVPFILLESASWDPRYYSTLLVKDNFDPNSSIWHESHYVDFFRFFQDVAGRRVRILLDDPDIQSQAYVDKDQLYILLNNLADKPEELALDLPMDGRGNITLRRFGRNPDFTPYFSESITNTLEGLTIGSREALALVVDYADVFQERLRLNEVPYYADQCRQSFSGSKTFNMEIPGFALAKSAVLRIGVGRGTGTDRDLEVLFNGSLLEVPLEDCAADLESSEYGSTKIIPLPVELLQSNNTIQVAFPYSGSGGVGAVVVRAAMEVPIVESSFGINCAGPQYIASDGTVYHADTNFTASNIGTDSLSAFDNTTEDALYKNERYAINGGNFSYHIPVDNGDYDVTLHMAENWFEVAGGREFNVDMEGSNVISRLDLFNVAGRAVAYDRTFSTTVADGSLDIDFNSSVNNSKINAIRITPVGGTVSAPVYSQWALDHGLSGTNTMRNLDLDGDGFDAYAEFVADTDPLSSTSRFTAYSAPVAQGFRISFPTAADRIYAVDAADDLTTGWTELTNGIPGSAGVMDIIDAVDSTNQFYRIKVMLD